MSSLVRLCKTLPFIRAHDARVIPEAVSVAEHEMLVDQILQGGQDRAIRRFRRRTYEEGHWDAVITGFKELERPLQIWSDDCEKVLRRLQAVIHQESVLSVQEDSEVHWLPPHVIDLSAKGEIRPHVDSVKFSGLVVAGLSLLSPRIMRLRENKESYSSDDPTVEMVLSPRSLYILQGDARFKASHSIDRNETSERRLSIIFRDAKGESST